MIKRENDSNNYNSHIMGKKKARKQYLHSKRKIKIKQSPSKTLEFSTERGKRAGANRRHEGTGGRKGRKKEQWKRLDALGAVFSSASPISPGGRWLGRRSVGWQSLQRWSQKQPGWCFLAHRSFLKHSQRWRRDRLCRVSSTCSGNSCSFSPRFLRSHLTQHWCLGAVPFPSSFPPFSFSSFHLSLSAPSLSPPCSSFPQASQNYEGAANTFLPPLSLSL